MPYGFNEDKSKFDIKEILNTKRNLIFIGDSYQKGTNNNMIGFIKYFKDWYSDRFGNIYNNQEGGYGFVGNNKKFITLLQNLEPTVENKEDITDIVCSSGYNDMYDLNGINDAMTEFMTYVRQTYPNAEVWLAPVGWNKKGNSENRINVREAIRHWLDDGSKHGMRIITNIACLFRDPTLLGSDYIHPNDAGQRALAHYMYVGLMNGAVDIVRGSTPMGYVKHSSISGNGLTNMFSYDRNGMCTVLHAWRSNITFTSNKTINCNGRPENAIDLGTIPNSLTQGYAWATSTDALSSGTWVNLVVKNTSANRWENVHSLVHIRQGHIYLSPHTANNAGGFLTITTNEIAIPAFEFTCSNIFG